MCLPKLFPCFFINLQVDCTKVLEALTEGLPIVPNILLWVGAWRTGVSWNHAKIIDVDGKYLHTGGHNLWTDHYLKQSPVFDLSVELEGRISRSAHLLANDHWAFIERKQKKHIGQVVDKLPDALPTVLKTRVTVTEFPSRASEFPPQYKKKIVPRYPKTKDGVNLVAVGRRGEIGDEKIGAADDAFVAMIESAHKIIRLALQDLGPLQIPGTKIALPSLRWPHEYLDALAKVIWTKGVDVELILSNPGSRSKQFERMM